MRKIFSVNFFRRKIKRKCHFGKTISILIKSFVCQSLSKKFFVLLKDCCIWDEDEAIVKHCSFYYLLDLRCNALREVSSPICLISVFIISGQPVPNHILLRLCRYRHDCLRDYVVLFRCRYPDDAPDSTTENLLG